MNYDSADFFHFMKVRSQDKWNSTYDKTLFTRFGTDLISQYVSLWIQLHNLEFYQTILIFAQSKTFSLCVLFLKKRNKWFIEEINKFFILIEDGKNGAYQEK